MLTENKLIFIFFINYYYWNYIKYCYILIYKINYVILYSGWCHSREKIWKISRVTPSLVLYYVLYLSLLRTMQYNYSHHGNIIPNIALQIIIIIIILKGEMSRFFSIGKDCSQVNFAKKNVIEIMLISNVLSLYSKGVSGAFN